MEMTPFDDDEKLGKNGVDRDVRQRKSGAADELENRLDGQRDERERLTASGDHVFEEVLEKYLDGHMSYDEVGMIVLDLQLDDEQDRIWQSLRNLEEGLIVRADVASQLDWLSEKVRDAVENQEQMRRWLAEISHGVLTFHVWQGHDEYQSLIKSTRLCYIGKYLGVCGGLAVLRNEIC
jgi:hypothetical protein